MTPEYNFKGVYPFREQEGIENAAEVFFIPLKKALSSMQRRQDIFIGGFNEFDHSKWVMSMGHFMGFVRSGLAWNPTYKKNDQFEICGI